MSSFGPKVLAAGGRLLHAFTNPEKINKKPGAVTIDWSKVTRTGDGTTDYGGVIVGNGIKFVRYGEVIRKVTATGKFGALDTTGSGGVELVTQVNGDVYIMGTTVTEADAHSDHQAYVADNGDVFLARILVTGTGAPTLANVRTMFPKVSFIS